MLLIFNRELLPAKTDLGSIIERVTAVCPGEFG